MAAFYVVELRLAGTLDEKRYAALLDALADRKCQAMGADRWSLAIAEPLEELVRVIQERLPDSADAVLVTSVDALRLVSQDAVVDIRADGSPALWPPNENPSRGRPRA